MPTPFDLDSPSNVSHHRRQVEDGDLVAGLDVQLSAEDQTTILVHLEAAVVETAARKNSSTVQFKILGIFLTAILVGNALSSKSNL